MANDAVNKLVVPEAPIKVSEFQRFRRVFLGRGVVIFGIVIIVFFIILSIFAPFIAPYSPNEPDLANILSQPTKAHLLGTDTIGRDILSRVIYGSRTSLIIGLSVVLIASSLGMVLGVFAAYYGGWIYNIIMRFIDALMSFPMIILVLVISALLGGGMKNVIIALTVGTIPGYTRVMCGQALSVKENDYVMAERSIGANSFRIMLRHLLPNCLPAYIVMMTMALGSVVLAEAGLSFLGVGITPPTAAWGSLVNDGRLYLYTLPLLSIAPGFVLMLCVFSFNMVGDGLRDALDPRLRGTL